MSFWLFADIGQDQLLPTVVYDQVQQCQHFRCAYWRPYFGLSLNFHHVQRTKVMLSASLRNCFSSVTVAVEIGIKHSAKLDPFTFKVAKGSAVTDLAWDDTRRPDVFVFAKLLLKTFVCSAVWHFTEVCYYAFPSLNEPDQQTEVAGSRLTCTG